MIVELIVKGVGSSEPLVLDVQQVLLRQQNGTPFMVAAVHGPNNAIAASMTGRDDFNQTLANLGIHETVIVDRLILPPPPPGARLVAGPSIQRK